MWDQLIENFCVCVNLERQCKEYTIRHSNARGAYKNISIIKFSIICAMKWMYEWILTPSGKNEDNKSSYIHPGQAKWVTKCFRFQSLLNMEIQIRECRPVVYSSSLPLTPQSKESTFFHLLCPLVLHDIYMANLQRFWHSACYIHKSFPCVATLVITSPQKSPWFLSESL